MSISAARRTAGGALIIAAAAGVISAAPAAAATATISPKQSCYVNTEKHLVPVSFTGIGWTAGDEIDVTSAGGGIDLFGDTTASSGGDISGSAGTSYVGTGFAAIIRTTTLTATDHDNNTTASTKVRITNRAVSIKPSSAKPSKKVRFSFSGFPGGRRIYAHYVHNGRSVLNYNFGRSAGLCSVHTHRSRMYPRGRARFNRYRVVFDNSKRYRKRGPSLFTATLTFYRY